ncbi:hypothetical protein [Candidatus Nitrospira neomarina]|uniref:Uncharacterized protein n=1 Tax=Candidatus Nitrospira neomarina TaxID=3020899 RepID=A0AA96GIP6_9BACT|nr:hypothetical protein [Candidatus Nitrospira neomarina]WNM60905.1 hypothetical protein PQG83_14210 [Candidatus Nitrospira neomarina]
MRPTFHQRIDASVKGDREVTTVLTIHPPDKDGNSRWELNAQATLYDVTHLRCRSARYTPTSSEGSCSPANVQKAAFPALQVGRCLQWRAARSKTMRFLS